MHVVATCGPALSQRGGSGTVPLFKLFCWNAINIHALVFSYACFTLCNDTLTTAHGLHIARSMLTVQPKIFEVEDFRGFRGSENGCEMFLP